MVESQRVQNGSPATKPDDPYRDGYRLLYWAKDGAAYDFSTPVTENITLTALWTKEIRLQSNGDSIPAGWTTEGDFSWTVGK